MSQKFVPKDPAKVMVTRQVVPNVITTFSVPFSRFGRIHVGGRGTVVRLASGALAVFSPVALTDEVKETVAKLGEVKYIAALDIEHHIFLGPWHAAYPKALVLAPEGLAEKRAKQKNENVPIGVTFTQSKPTTVDPEFDSEFEYEYVYAHANKELVFNHKPSKTLIEADFIFNLPATEQYSKTDVNASAGILTKIFKAINNTQGAAMGQRRFIWYAISAGDRKGYAQSVARIDKWDFERIVPCHGDVIETGGKGIFRKIMQWHLEASAKAK